MALPTALVIGPMKAGTTWIHEYFAWRGDVCLPNGVKETFFFDRYTHRGLDWYESYFRHLDPVRHAQVVEVAPSLFHDANAPERVRAILGEVPLIVTAREPVARAWSHYQHLRRKGYTRAPLASALEDFPEIVEASRYKANLVRWQIALPCNPITVLYLENLSTDRNGYTDQLCRAVTLPARPAPDSLGEANSGGVPPSFLVARTGRAIATALRSAGGYAAVDFAKKIGLKPVFFGADGGRRIKPSDDDLALLRAALGHDSAWDIS